MERTMEWDKLAHQEARLAIRDQWWGHLCKAPGVVLRAAGLALIGAGVVVLTGRWWA